MARQKTSKTRISPEIVKAREESDRFLEKTVNLSMMAILNAAKNESYALNDSTPYFNPKNPSTYPQMDMSLRNFPQSYGMAGRR